MYGTNYPTQNNAPCRPGCACAADYLACLNPGCCSPCSSPCASPCTSSCASPCYNKLTTPVLGSSCLGSCGTGCSSCGCASSSALLPSRLDCLELQVKMVNDKLSSISDKLGNKSGDAAPAPAAKAQTAATSAPQPLPQQATQ